MNGIFFAFAVVVFTWPIMVKCSASRKYSPEIPERSSVVDEAKHRKEHKHSHSRHRDPDQNIAVTLPSIYEVADDKDLYAYHKVPSSLKDAALMGTDFETELFDYEDNDSRLGRNPFMGLYYESEEDIPAIVKPKKFIKRKPTIYYYNFEKLQRTANAAGATTPSTPTTTSFRRADFTRNPATHSKIKIFSTPKSD